jgi:hypothetical protein
VRTRLAPLRLLLAVAVGVLVLAGCSGDPAAAPTRGNPSQKPPVLGGPTPTPHADPTAEMDGLERPVHERLASQIAGQGLTLTYLDCPRWDKSVPSRMVCRGYVDGLVARVAVHLKAAVEGRAVSFDARLLDGVIATHNLVSTLHEKGWDRVDCGDVPAYPSRVGSRIVCHVQRPSDDRYVVATVSARNGAVMIRDYKDAS